MFTKGNSTSKDGTKPHVNLLPLMALLVFGMIALVGVVSAGYDYNGSALVKATSGSCNGDLWVSAGNHSGLPTSGYYYPQTYNTTYTLPSVSSVEWAKLYIGLWGGKQSRTGYAETTLVNSSGSYVLANETLDINGMNSNVNCVGNGTWLITYDVKDYLTSGDTPTVSVYTQNTTVDGITPCFDGRVYGATLVVAYNSSNSSELITYQVNDGLVNLNNPYQLNTNRTEFDDVSYSSTEAEITLVQLAGNANQPDYVYFNPTDEDDSPYRLDVINWDTSIYEEYQLDSADVANGSEGSNYDLDVFTASSDSTSLKDLVNQSGNNYIVFKRGLDSNDNGIIDAGYYDSTKEGESYLSPIIAIVKLTRSD